MARAEIPTFLGGDYANLAWDDLQPRELVMATVSSSVRAEKAKTVAIAQADAAAELGDTVEERQYRNSARILAAMTQTNG
jgi:hypothetical protein